MKVSSRSSAVTCENKRTSNRFYNSIFGKFAITRSVKHKVSNLSTGEKKVIAEETVVFVASSLIRRGLELRLANRFGRVSKTLNIYPVMQLDQKILITCYSGDISGLQTVFEVDTLSPYVSDNFGQHYFMFVH